MRVNALIVVAAIGAASGVAHAEKVKTNQRTKVFLHPGEQEKVLFTLKSGQNMTLLATEGRWLKVRVHGRTGYVTRTKVDMPDGDEIVRNTRRRPFVDGRSTKRGFGGQEGPDDRIGADAVGEGDDGSASSGSDDSSDSGDGGDSDSDSDSGKSSKSAKRGKSHASRSHGDDGGDDDADDAGDDDGGKATAKARRGDDDSDSDGGDSEDSDSGDGKVTDDGGDDDGGDGDRPTVHVTAKTRILAQRDPDSDEQFVARPTDALYPSETKGRWTFVEDDEGDGGWVLTDKLDLGDRGGGLAKRQIDLHARGGFMFISQGMRTVGSQAGVPDNYNISTSAADLALGASVLYPYGKQYLIGGEATLDYAKTLFGGIAVPGQTGTTTFGITNFTIHATGGYDLHKKNGLAVFARLGYRYRGYIVDNYKDLTKNSAKIPNEVFQAPTIGAAIAIPKLTDKIGLRASLDTSLFGVGVKQTVGYEDGTKHKAMAVTVEGGVTYHWKKGMDLQGIYDLEYDQIDFGMPLATSQRGHTGSDVRRTDFFNVLTFGITKAF